MTKRPAKKRHAPLEAESPREDDERELSHIIQDREFERETARASSDRFVNPGHMGYVGPDE